MKPSEKRAPAPQAGELGRLVEAEERLDDLVRRAEDEARRAVEAAREAARRDEERIAAEIAAAEAALQARIAAEVERETARTVDEARRATEAFEGVPDERVAALAARALERIARGAA